MKCDVCGGPAKPHERNTDGTVTCERCLRRTKLEPVRRGPNGGNLYNERSGENDEGD